MTERIGPSPQQSFVLGLILGGGVIAGAGTGCWLYKKYLCTETTFPRSASQGSSPEGKSTKAK